jgi:predicted DNA binding CopG/RHH family protein
MKKERINIRVSEEKKKWLKKFAADHGKTVTSLFEEYVDDLIERFGPESNRTKISLRD